MLQFIFTKTTCLKMAFGFLNFDFLSTNPVVSGFSYVLIVISNILFKFITDYYYPLLLLSLYFFYSRKFIKKQTKLYKDNKISLLKTIVFVLALFLFINQTYDYNLLLLNTLPISHNTKLVVSEFKKLAKLMVELATNQKAYDYTLLKMSNTIQNLALNSENVDNVKYLPLPIENELVKTKPQYINKLIFNEEFTNISLTIEDNLIEETNIDSTIDILNKYQNIDDVIKLNNIKLTIFHRSATNDFIKFKVEGFFMSSEQNYFKDSLELLFTAFSLNKDYINFSKNKIVFIQGLNPEISNQSRPLHNSVALSNNTTFEEYYNKVKDLINSCWNGGYEDYFPNQFEIWVSNSDKLRNTKWKQKANGKLKRYYSTNVKFNSTKLTDPEPLTEVKKVKKLRVIKPLNKKNVNPSLFCTVDIETIILDNNKNDHIPIAISTHSQNFSKLFIIDYNLLMEDSELAVKILFKQYLDFMTLQKKSYTIFAHNLGNYDGYFLYKYLLATIENIDDLSTLIDADNKFITLNYTHFFIDGEGDESFAVFTWKDSLRIFPGTLEDICKQFGVEGKISKYNPDYNTIDLFNKPILLEEFKQYSLQDSVALYNALFNAQKLYIKQYQVDICDIYSTASLAFKIFRTHFLKSSIPLLSNDQDNFIRQSYLGGATDYYIAKSDYYLNKAKYYLAKFIGDKVYWYDVNSLYPYAMLETVPYKIKNTHTDLSKVKAKNFKGFVLAQVTCPENIKHPIVAYKHEGKTIYPKGTWKGVYFSEYLAKAETFGYKIELISGIEFEYKDLFSDYIKHFYEIKKTAKGSLRYLAKLKLNSLYGMFGRKQINSYSLNIKTEDIPSYSNINIIKNVIDYNNGYSTIVCESSPNFENIRKLNIELETTFKHFDLPTYANVAIASAITSRAQMIMMDYKNNPNFEIYYTDTDSIFTNKPLPDYMVGNALGQMKNETLDKYGIEYLDKACFVGIKKYGLVVTDKNDVTHELSTFAGVPKNELTFDEVTKIQNGEIIKKKVKDRFHKTFNDLSIKTQSNITLQINNKRDKALINNEYIPITINNYDFNDSSLKRYNDLVKRFNRINKKYKK
jgi:hypothetical protein